MQEFPDFELELGCPLQFRTDEWLELGSPDSTVEMFGVENETGESLDGEDDEIRPLDVGSLGGLQLSDRGEMYDRAGSQGDEMKEGLDPHFVDVHEEVAGNPPEMDNPCEDLNPAGGGNHPDTDFVVEADQAVKDSADPRQFG